MSHFWRANLAATRGEVQKKLNEALEKRNRGLNIAPERITLGQFLESWLEYTVKPGVRPRTYRNYQQMVRNHLAKTVPPGEWEKNKLDSVLGIGNIRPRDLSVEKLAVSLRQSSPPVTRQSSSDICEPFFV